jgi:predicted DNA repair protein MutK
MALFIRNGAGRMAASSLLVLIDDIAAILDDVALLSKVAAEKTAGVLGDDLALNAQQVSGVNPERELPVVWAVGVGSLKNKAILVPSALAISALAPWAITPLLMVGGAYLCYEGCEKLAHKYLHSDQAAADARHHAQMVQALSDPAADVVALEKDKIKGAVRTDFILSAEIIVISLGTVAAAPFMQQVATLCVIAVVMTVGVYGLVAAIVKLDDVGLHLSQTRLGALRAAGRMLVVAAPKIMKTLTVVGTAAMFMVGGSILVHGVHPLHAAVEGAGQAAAGVPLGGALLAAVTPTLLNAVAGLVAGALVLLAATGATRVFKRRG